GDAAAAGSIECLANLVDRERGAPGRQRDQVQTRQKRRAVAGVAVDVPLLLDQHALAAPGAVAANRQQVRQRAGRDEDRGLLAQLLRHRLLEAGDDATARVVVRLD